MECHEGSSAILAFQSCFSMYKSASTETHFPVQYTLGSPVWKHSVSSHSKSSNIYLFWWAPSRIDSFFSFLILLLSVYNITT